MERVSWALPFDRVCHLSLLPLRPLINELRNTLLLNIVNTYVCVCVHNHFFSKERFVYVYPQFFPLAYVALASFERLLATLH